MSIPSVNIIRRGFSTCCVRYGKRNFKDFTLINKRGPRDFKEKQATDPYSNYPIVLRGLRNPGLKVKGKFEMIKEMVPELMVPSLEGFKLKPYVSYKSLDVQQEAFTAQDLFDCVYKKKVIEDFKNNRLDENGQSLEPNENELLTPQEARDNATKPGADMFTREPEQNHVIMSPFKW